MIGHPIGVQPAGHAQDPGKGSTCSEGAPGFSIAGCPPSSPPLCFLPFPPPLPWAGPGWPIFYIIPQRLSAVLLQWQVNQAASLGGCQHQHPPSELRRGRVCRAGGRPTPGEPYITWLLVIETRLLLFPEVFLGTRLPTGFLVGGQSAERPCSREVGPDHHQQPRQVSCASCSQETVPLPTWCHPMGAKPSCVHPAGDRLHLPSPGLGTTAPRPTGPPWGVLLMARGGSSPRPSPGLVQAVPPKGPAPFPDLHRGTLGARGRQP